MLKGFRFWQVLVMVILGTCIMGNEALAAKRVVASTPDYLIFDAEQHQSSGQARIRASIYSSANVLTMNRQVIHTANYLRSYAMVRTLKPAGQVGYDFNLVIAEGGSPFIFSLKVKRFGGDDFRNGATVNIPIPNGFFIGSGISIKADMSGNIYVLLSSGNVVINGPTILESLCLVVIDQNLNSTASVFTPQSPGILTPTGVNHIFGVDISIDAVTQRANIGFENFNQQSGHSTHFVEMDLTNFQIIDDRTLSFSPAPYAPHFMSIVSTPGSLGVPGEVLLAHPLNYTGWAAIGFQRRDSQGIWNSVNTSTPWWEPLMLVSQISNLTSNIVVVHATSPQLNGSLVLQSSNDLGLTFSPPVMVDNTLAILLPWMGFSLPNDNYSAHLWPNLPMVAKVPNGPPGPNTTSDAVLYEYEGGQYQKRILYALPTSSSVWPLVYGFQIIPY